MADPNIHNSLEVFLNYDFDHQRYHTQRLGVVKRDDGTSYLMCLSKKDNKKQKEFDSSLSLKKVVAFVKNHQDTWLKEATKQYPKLEYQLAWLERKVKERNQAPLKKDITYTNPAKCTLNVKIILNKAFEEKDQKKIKTTEWSKSYTFDRLCTHKAIYDTCTKAINASYVLTINCTSEKCKSKTHKIRIKSSQLFGNFTFLKNSVTPDQNSTKLFHPIENPASEVTVSLEATSGDNKLLNRLIQTLHQAAKKSAHSNDSSTSSSSVFDAYYLLGSSCSNNHHSCGSSGGHHHSCGSSGGHHHSCASSGGHHTCGSHHSSCGGFSSCGGGGGGGGGGDF